MKLFQEHFIILYNIRVSLIVAIAEDCKSSVLRLRWFESYSGRQIYTYRVQCNGQHASFGMMQSGSNPTPCTSRGQSKSPQPQCFVKPYRSRLVAQLVRKIICSRQKQANLWDAWFQGILNLINAVLVFNGQHVCLPSRRYGFESRVLLHTVGHLFSPYEIKGSEIPLKQ